MTTSPRNKPQKFSDHPLPHRKKLFGEHKQDEEKFVGPWKRGLGLGIYSMYIIYCITYLEKHTEHVYKPLQIHQYRSSWWNQPIWKNIFVKLDHFFPNFRDEHEKCLSCDHLVPHFGWPRLPILPQNPPLPTEQTVWSGTQLCHASVWVFNQLQAVSLIQANKFEAHF